MILAAPYQPVEVSAFRRLSSRDATHCRPEIAFPSLQACTVRGRLASGHVNRHLKISWSDRSAVERPLEEKGVFVVTVYNTNIGLTQGELESAAILRARVGSVHRLHEQETAIVIVSMAYSSQDEGFPSPYWRRHERSGVPRSKAGGPSSFARRG